METAAFGCETAGGGWSQPPAGGLADGAREMERGERWGEGRGAGMGPGTAGSWKLRPSGCETACGGSVQPPSGGLANEARNF